VTRALLVLVPLGTALAAVLATGLPLAGAILVGLGVGVLAGGSLAAVNRRRTASLADAVNRWIGDRGYEPVEAGGDPDWERLTVAVNALGAAYDRRGTRLQRARHLRIELVDALAEPAMLFGRDGRLVRSNPTAQAELDIPDDPGLSVVQALGSAQFATAVEEAHASGRSVEIEGRVGERDINALAAPIGNEILVILSDVSERRLVDAMRRDFVANASHELKTPVSGIQALADALTVIVERDPERAHGLATRLSEEAERLAKLVHALLDLRRLEEEHAIRDPGPVDLSTLVEEQVARVLPSAGRRGVAVETDVPDRAIVAGVREDLRLVIANLLDNAVAYNRPGGRVRVALERGDGAWVLVVTDTGIGIGRADLDRIFERFYRVDVARSRATGGTGLGLSLVRHAVERHGGRIDVDSMLGSGTRFTVEIPVEHPPG
jgi:signal transduction histidine kinase